MAVYELPINSDDPNYNFEIDLLNSSYIFEFKYNAIADKWSMSIYDDEENPIISGIFLVQGINYLDLKLDSRLPRGYILLENFSNQNIECGRDNLGNEFALALITED